MILFPGGRCNMLKMIWGQNTMFNSWLIIISPYSTTEILLSPVQWRGKSLSISNMPPLLSLVGCWIPVNARSSKRCSTFGDDIPGPTFCRKRFETVHGVTFSIRNRPSWRCPFTVWNRPSLSSFLRFLIGFVRVCTVHPCYQVQECVIYIFA